MLNLKMLKGYLTVMARIAKHNDMMPVLEYALLSPTGIKVSNLELEFELKIDTGLDAECLVLFSDLKKVATLAKKSLSLTYNSDTDKITMIADDKRKLSFTCGNVSDFPLMVVEGDFAPKCEITGKTLTMLGKFISKDEVRPARTGIYFDASNAVATDAHRLAFPKINALSEDTFILSGHNIKAINTKSEYMLSFDGVNHCKLENDEVSIISRKIDSRYPNYKAVIPIDNPKESIIDKKDFLEACKYGLLACNQTTKQLNIDFSIAGCKMSAKDVDFDSDFESTLDATFSDTESLGISFNGVFAQGIVAECDTDKVSFKMSTPNRATIVNDMFLLMPVMR